MRKRIRFYGMTIELTLRGVSCKEVAKYIRRKLNNNSFYIQKKRDGSYVFYYEANANEGVTAGYYLCEFGFDEVANVA